MSYSFSDLISARSLDTFLVRVMDKIVTLAVIFLFLIVTDVTSASLLSKFRYLVAVHSSNDYNKSAPSQVSPSPSPVSTLGTSYNAVSNDSKKDPLVPNGNVPQKANHTASSKKGSEKSNRQNRTNGANNQETKKSEDDKTMSESVTAENCTGMPKRCKDRDSLVACIPNFRSVWRISLKLSWRAPLGSVVAIPCQDLELLTWLQINVTVDKSTKLIFAAGNGECVLHICHDKPEDKFSVRLPSLEKLVTSINGAYFLMFTVIIFGGTWACCKFRKKRRVGEVTYQELEMGLPESHMTNNVESAEGWDQVWDDDWDEETAVKSPVNRHPVGSISTNGLTSRASSTDGWQNEWDD